MNLRCSPPPAPLSVGAAEHCLPRHFNEFPSPSQATILRTSVIGLDAKSQEFGPKLSKNHQHLIFCKLKSLYLGYLMFRNPLRSPQLKLNVSIIFHNISLFLQSCFNQKSLKSNPGPKNRQKAPKSHRHITVWNRTSLQPLIARFAHPDQ